MKFSDIDEAYVGNVSRSYQSPVAVFDGNDKDNTKSHKHFVLTKMRNDLKPAETTQNQQEHIKGNNMVS